MALFTERCSCEGPVFHVECTLTDATPNDESIHSLYAYIRTMRTLPLPFHVTWDTSKASMVSYLTYVNTILEELNILGKNPCYAVVIRVSSSAVQLLLQAYVDTFVNTYDYLSVKIVTAQ